MHLTKHSEEAKAKMRASHLGKKQTDNHKKSISDALKKSGHRPPQVLYWKGKHRSPEDKEKMRQAKLRNPMRYWLGKERPDMSGDKNPNFGKFGPEHSKWVENKKCILDKQIRSSFKYRQWRSDVFTRDNFTCINCGATKIYLEADHYPIMFVEIRDAYNLQTLEQAFECEALWNINNGRTLCKECHKKIGRRKKIQ